MKVVLVFAAVIAGTLAAAVGKGNILVVEELKLHYIHEACEADPATSVDHELLHNLADNIDNPQVGAHMLCEAKGVGLLDEDGTLDVDNVREKIGLTVKSPAKVNRLVNRCAIERETPELTAVYLFWCLDQYGVTYFHEF